MLATGPHSAIPVTSSREKFLAALFDRLWTHYRERVRYVQTYEQVLAKAGGSFVNDHIAFRTFATQSPHAGIAGLSRPFEALGYRAAGNYHFEDKHLSAIHYQHANAQFPKLFISELRLWELPAATQHLVKRCVAQHRPLLSEETLAALSGLDRDSTHREQLLTTCVDFLERLPWPAPEKADVAIVNQASQYAAWVMVHGYNVNHFTSLTNSHGVPALADIEQTIDALKAAGVPMKAEIEGERGSKLRQTATEAVLIDVDVCEGGVPTKMPWSYAYFELAQRDLITDPESGRRVRFEGFLGPQATNLFEMTRVKKG